MSSLHNVFTSFRLFVFTSPLRAAQIPLFLYPLLNTVSRHRPFEYLRLTSLGVIGALVKVDDTEIVNFLLQTEIIPLCLRIMESGSELSKTVATFVVQKILLDDAGLTYICATAERFYAVSFVLSSMVTKLLETPSVRLLKHIVRCYLRLSEHQRARDALRQCLPEPLKDQTFAAAINSEESVQRWLSLLIKNLSEPSSNGGVALGAAVTPGGGPPAQVAGIAVAGAKPVGSTGAFGYSNVPVQSANWNS
jgi:CCR4-NOT transcription complex subunit 9